MPTTLPAHDHSRARPRSPGADLADGIGWTLVAVLTLAVLLSWLPSVTAGLGDNHEGRILARHALNVQNAQTDGLAASGWLSDWSPYRGGPDGGQVSYAHHPPLMNFGYYVAGQVLPVPLDTAMRVFSYLAGIAMLPLGVALLRRLDFRWVPVLAATVAVAVTPLFWVYARLGGATTLLVAMTLMIVRLREPRTIGPAELALAAVVSVAAVVAGYLGLATAALLGIALLVARGMDRVTVVVGAAMAIGAAITLAYVLGGSGLGEISDQLEMRTQGGGFSTGEFLARIGDWATALLPVWWRWLLLPAAVIAGLLDHRSRIVTSVFAAVAAGYVFGLPNGAYIHDYWIFPVLLPVWVGTAALVKWAGSRLGRPDAPAAAAAALLLVMGVGGLLRDDVADHYFTQPEAAGELARSTGPPPHQPAAWRTAGLAAPRWLSLYWNLPPAVVGRDDVEDLARDELVFVALDGTPGWLDAAAVRAAARRVEGDYAVIDGADLQRIATGLP